MVNAKRVERKLPSLLVDGDTTKKVHYNKFMRYRYRLERFKRKNPQKYNTSINVILAELVKIEQGANKE